jgi:hypothetical protein
MASEYIEVDLDKEEKQAILKYASFFIADATTNSDLLNKRKKWIRFNHHALSDIIGELSYHFNRCKNDYQFIFLDQLISHLENYENRSDR